MARTTAKKRWFTISAPKLFKETAIGETISLEPKAVLGKTVSINLSTLTNDMRNHNTEVTLLFDKIEGDKVKTSLIGLRVLPTSIRRVVRKGRSRLDISLKSMTKGNEVVTYKVLLITRRVVKGSVLSALDAEARRFLTKKISVSDFTDLFESAIFGKLSRELLQKLNKIYPLRICEIRALKLERFMKAADLRKVKAEIVKESKKSARKRQEEPESPEQEQAPEPVEEAEEQKEDSPVPEAKADSDSA